MKIDRRTFIQGTVLGGLQAVAGIEASVMKRPKDDDVLTILHTNDTHSRIEPFPLDDSRHANLGGAARRATLIKKIRSESSNVLLLDAGDIFQGTPYFNFFKGELDYKLMSAMGYDASTIGNHDFDAGLDGLRKVLPLAKFPLITANYDFSKTILKGYFDPFRIIQKGTVRVGVFGLGPTLKGLVDPRLTAETQRMPPGPIAQEMVQELRDKKCHLIICLSHLGYRPDQRLAKEVSGIDVIIGGHSHTFMKQPDRIINSEGFSTLIHQVGFGGIRLGRIDLTFSRSQGNFAFTGSGSIPICADCPGKRLASIGEPMSQPNKRARTLKIVKRTGRELFV
jgi:5'-nucleotidase